MLTRTFNSLFIYLLCALLLVTLYACVGSTDSGKVEKKTIVDKVTVVQGNSQPVNTTADAKEETKEVVFDPEKIIRAKEIISSVTEGDLAGLDAQKLFRKNCAICHGRKGNMKINGAKDLRISKLSMEERVANIYFGQGLMTPFKGVMTEAEIVATAEYIAGFRQ